jgi:hypothetical protein
MDSDVSHHAILPLREYQEGRRRQGKDKQSQPCLPPDPPSMSKGPQKKTKLKQPAPSKIKKNQSFQVSWDTSENRYDFSKIN